VDCGFISSSLMCVVWTTRTCVDSRSHFRIISTSSSCVVWTTRTCVDSRSHFFSCDPGDMNSMNSWRRCSRAYDVTVICLCIPKDAETDKLTTQPPRLNKRPSRLMYAKQLGCFENSNLNIRLVIRSNV